MSQTKKQTTPDIELVRQLAGVLTESGLTEIEYDTVDLRVRVAKTPAPAAIVAPTVAATAQAGLTRPSEAGSSTEPEYAGHPGLLTSPMVGVVFVSPEPQAPPFVQVGDSVAVGDTVLLIEAMKVFNPIKAHRSGQIERIFVSSGMPVEYGEPLLLIV